MRVKKTCRRGKGDGFKLLEKTKLLPLTNTRMYERYLNHKHKLLLGIFRDARCKQTGNKTRLSFIYSLVFSKTCDSGTFSCYLAGYWTFHCMTFRTLFPIIFASSSVSSIFTVDVPDANNKQTAVRTDSVPSARVQSVREITLQSELIRARDRGNKRK